MRRWLVPVPGTSGLRGRVFCAQTYPADEAKSRIARQLVSKRRRWGAVCIGLARRESVPSVDQQRADPLEVRRAGHESVGLFMGSKADPKPNLSIYQCIQ